MINYLKKIFFKNPIKIIKFILFLSVLFISYRKFYKNSYESLIMTIQLPCGHKTSGFIFINNQTPILLFKTIHNISLLKNIKGHYNNQIFTIKPIKYYDGWIGCTIIDSQLLPSKLQNYYPLNDNHNDFKGFWKYINDKGLITKNPKKYFIKLKIKNKKIIAFHGYKKKFHKNLLIYPPLINSLDGLIYWDKNENIYIKYLVKNKYIKVPLVNKDGINIKYSHYCQLKPMDFSSIYIQRFKKIIPIYLPINKFFLTTAYNYDYRYNEFSKSLSMNENGFYYYYHPLKLLLFVKNQEQNQDNGIQKEIFIIDGSKKPYKILSINGKVINNFNDFQKVNFIYYWVLSWNDKEITEKFYYDKFKGIKKIHDF